MFEFKPDYEECKRRLDAWWHRAVIDRPPVYIHVPRVPPAIEAPVSNHATLRERWLDAEFQARRALATCANTLHLGDAMPVAWPNLGPEVFTAWFGAELEFTETTSWSVPILRRWEDADALALDMDNFYFRKMVELTDAFLEIGRGKFITGLTDFHSGGDHLAALRNPQDLAMDVIERPDDVKRLLARMEGEYFRAYDFFYRRLKSEGQPISTWTPMLADGKYYVVSNDFSCMISKKQFDDLFLPGIVNECRFLDHSIYHLDGPGALHHLDSLLAIEELDALQWVCGAGQEDFRRWSWIYQRAQRAGKGVEVRIRPWELDAVFETLRPEGVWLIVAGVKTPAEADQIVRRVARWQ